MSKAFLDRAEINVENVEEGRRISGYIFRFADDHSALTARVG